MTRPIPRILDARGRALAALLARDAHERWLAGEILAILRGAFDEIASELDAAGPSLRDRQRLAALYQRLGGILEHGYGRAAAFSERQLTRLAAVEVEAAAAELAARVVDLGADAAVVTDSLGSFMSRQLVESVATLPIDGLRLGEWWRSQARAMSVATRRAIQLGLVQGESLDHIVRRIVPARGTVAPSVWRQARGQTVALVRTATTAVHADAAVKSYEAAGSKVTGEYELLTARDNRVSKICAALDGQRFRYDDPKRKMPPFHIQCRTVTIPVINYRALRLKEPGAQSPLTIRSFDAWLRHQPPPAQREILGATRARWYQEGRLPLRQLIDEDTRVLTLEELAARLGTLQDVPGVAADRRTAASAPAIARGAGGP